MSGKNQGILKWLKIGLSLTNSVLYPYRKFVRFGQIEMERADFARDTSLTNVSITNLSDTSAFDSEIMAELFYEDDLPISTKPAIDLFIKIIDYANYAVMAMSALDSVTKLCERDIKIFGIRISKNLPRLIRVLLIVAGLAFLVSLALEKLMKAKRPSQVNKKIWDMMAFISDFMKLVFALYGLFLVCTIIGLRMNGKKWKSSDTANLLSAIVMILGVLDIKLVEKRLADSKKGYFYAVGISTAAKLIKTGSMFFTTDEQSVSIETNKFKNAEVDDNALFLYFCGTGENTSKHVNQFMNDVKAKYQIYVNGIGSSQSVYEKLYENDLEVENKSLDKNSRKYYFETGNRNITCIEKAYSGGALSGYKKIDGEQVAEYALRAFQETLNAHPNIDKIIISGHSRGAAVALMSFLYELVKNSKDLLPRLSRTKIAVFPLDPVAGQPGNEYLMGSDWTSKEIYEKLFDKFSARISVCEVWARSAEMLMHDVALNDFNPAERFLSNPSASSLMLKRFLLGYEHSAMVSAEEKYSEHYSRKSDSPYQIFVVFLNEYIDSVSDLNAANFTKICKKYKDSFKDVDELNERVGKENLIVLLRKKTLRGKYKNHAGEEVNFFDFIDSF